MSDHSVFEPEVEEPEPERPDRCCRTPDLCDKHTEALRRIGRDNGQPIMMVPVIAAAIL